MNARRILLLVASCMEHGLSETGAPRNHYALFPSEPVTPLTPLRGACPAAVAHAPHRCTPARRVHAPLPRVADGIPRGAGATDSERNLPPLPVVFQPSRRGSHAISRAHRRSCIPGRTGGVRGHVEPRAADARHGQPFGGPGGRAP